ncbi:MAG: hypothetical protein DWQ06_08025 [Calditrichaeota bacterium]|nr:MAG: hypothetical protein DWQ06_08025 [Calditrichota bacterium]
MSKKNIKFFRFQRFIFSVTDFDSKYFSEIEKYFPKQNNVKPSFKFEILKSNSKFQIDSPKVHSTPNLDYYRENDSFYIVFKRDGSFCEIKSDECKFYVEEFLCERTDVFFDWMFEIALVEVLRKNGYYFLHAGCVAKNDFCVVIPGASGNGKTTLSYLLSQNGFKLVSDDRIFFEEESNFCFAFPTPVKLTEESQRLLNLNLNEEVSYQGKALVSKNTFETTEKAIPKIFVFPKIIKGKSSLSKLEKSEAFSKLLSLSLTLSDFRAVKSQLSKMQSILNDCQCFELNFGQDFEEIPRIFENLLEN